MSGWAVFQVDTTLSMAGTQDQKVRVTGPAEVAPETVDGDDPPEQEASSAKATSPAVALRHGMERIFGLLGKHRTGIPSGGAGRFGAVPEDAGSGHRLLGRNWRCQEPSPSRDPGDSSP
jgi:hypothetical protein